MHGQMNDKEDVVCTHTHTHTHTHTLEYHSAIKNNETLPFARMWMELEGIMLSEISPSEKDKYHMISFICGILETKEENKGKKERE